MLRFGTLSIVALLLLATEVSWVSPARAQQGVELSEQLAAATSAEADRELEETLRRRYDRLSGLAELAVSVEAGIVRLEGRAADSEAAARAVEIARRTEGVADVEDAIEVAVDPVSRLRATRRQAEERLLELVARLPLFAVAVLLFALFALLARGVGRWHAPFRRLGSHPFAQELARQVTVLAIVVLGAVVALDLLDATSLVAALLGTAGIAGIALGFAFRDLAENYIASVLLSLRQPFAPRDHVVIDGSEGLVIRLTSRATILMTLDGNHLRLPNSKVFKATILNYTRNPTRRFGIAVGVGVDVDLVEAQRLGIEVLAATPGVLHDPPPSARVDALGESNVAVRFFGWVDQRQHDFAQVQSAAIRRVKLTLDDAGIDMPEPIYRVKLEGRDLPAATVPAAPTRRRSRSEPEAAPEPAADRAHLEKRIDAERSASGEEDLLDPAAPVE
ncbi:MAG TPA: mechanosensitive ion channel domain-containing protein [Thermoanaerobaculia bacterium]|nr:mechanosensitive ion channel domain-containing protein [Thermoanaerobaculia bacterium]